MRTIRKHISILLILLLLFAGNLFFFACKGKQSLSFEEQSSESEIFLPTQNQDDQNETETERASGNVNASLSEESDSANDTRDSTAAQSNVTEGETTDKASQTDAQNGALEETGASNADQSSDLPSSDGSGEGSQEKTDEEGEEETDFDPSEFFDLLVKIGVLYRSVNTPYPSDLFFELSALGENYGFARFVENGNIEFSYDFVEKKCSLWGYADETDTLYYYVWFDTLEDLRRIEVQPESAIVRIAFSEEDFARLTLSKENEQKEEQGNADPSQEGENDSEQQENNEQTGAPDGQEDEQQQGTEQQGGEQQQSGENQQGNEQPQGDEPQQGNDQTQEGDTQQNGDVSSDDPTSQSNGGQSSDPNPQGDPGQGVVTPSEENPPAQEDGSEQSGEDERKSLEESGAYDLVLLLPGTMRNLSVVTMYADEEQFGFLLEDLDADDCWSLIGILDLSFADTDHYRAQKFIGGMVYNFAVDVEESFGGYQAAITVTGYSLE